MLAVGQRPAAMPRSTMPAKSMRQPEQGGRARDPLGAHRPAGALCASDPATAVAGRPRRRPRLPRGTRFCARVGDPREVHAVGDQRDGERGRGAPDEQRAQVAPVVMAWPLLRCGSRAVGDRGCLGSDAGERLRRAPGRARAGAPTSSPRASPAAVTTVRPACLAGARRRSRSQRRRRGANSEVASPANASSANTSTNGSGGVVAAGRARRSGAGRRTSACPSRRAGRRSRRA